MAINLFSEFGPTNKSAWQQQVEQEIKRPVAELNRTTNTSPNELDPYYSHEEFNPENFFELNSCQKKDPGWLNMPEVVVNDPMLANDEIQKSLSGGAQAMLLHLQNNLTINDVSRLLHKVRLTDVPVFFKTPQNPSHLFELISKGSGYAMKGGIADDPVANWMNKGTSFDHSLKEKLSVCKATETMADFYPLMVESHVFHNAGATQQQELAFLVASFVSYLDKLTDNGISPSLALKSVFFSVSVGTDYMTEISKMRALRLLHKRITDAYGVNAAKPFIHASSSSFYYADTLPHTNMLRATSSAMSAVIGGCDALTVTPYDNLLRERTDFSARIARNVSSIIAHESYINQVSDPAAGSYFIEKKSNELAESAWQLFLDVERRGGIIASFENGFIQDEIDKSWHQKLEAMRNGSVMVGVNKYSNESPEIIALTKSEDHNETGIRVLPNRNLAKTWHLLHQ
ncbi:methylmalonyl-CoA mutase family protein [Dyadobacter sp. CY312]|uniref:methylmalonyl-CoA mutase family protein n=1 Tax=Dyadobacter sp. CY312 TaxID=2907303 RepID=UPI001F3FBA60|nr:methylmalonyl-CoA mutase family protein [Dyadobacter sp. CY312]MCE7041571.1 methylmalonyl-CoA mutase family protein [Dyadobacter sp. CY312]